MRKNIINEIIIGGGISGLLWKYYNPESTLITDNIGGQSTTEFELGPRFLHYDEHTKKLLKDLKIKSTIRKIKIGFYYNNVINNINTKENRKRYFRKTRNLKTKTYSSVMSSNKTDFYVYVIKLNKIIEKLKENIYENVIISKIKKINLNEQFVITEENKTYYYEKLISTIPLNIFLFLTNNKLVEQFKTYPTTFILNKEKNFTEYDYVYFSEQQYKYHRITKTNKGYVYEHKGDNIPIMKNEIDRVVLKTGQLVENEYNIKFRNVHFFGRYATWQHKILINHLLQEIYETKKYI